MIDALPPYPEMRDSEVAWLGAVPAHWAVRRAKTLFDTIDRRSVTGDEELLTVSSKRGVVRRADSIVTMFKAESYIGHKMCWPGDLVVNSLWAWANGLGFSSQHGLVSSAYSVYRPKPEKAAYVEYWNRLLRSDVYGWEFITRSKGVWISRLQLADAAFMDMPVIVPPADEQAAIVRFLADADRRIGAYVAAKLRLVKLLEEAKAAIVHRAVTRGLNPAAPLKPSGVPWLGDIPAHWEVIRFKRIIQIERGQVDPRMEQHLNKPLIAPNHIRSGTGELIAIETAHEQGADSGKYQIRTGDIIYSKIRPALRKGVISPVDGLCSADMYPIRPDLSRIRPEYLLQIILSEFFTSAAVDASLRVAMPKVNRETLGELLVWFPPLEEQDEILAMLDRESATPFKAIATARAEIALLREYRTRLIADVVTGKRDVRAAAAALPDIADDAVPLDLSGDDTDTDTDTDTDDDAADFAGQVAA